MKTTLAVMAICAVGTNWVNGISQICLFSLMVGEDSSDETWIRITDLFHPYDLFAKRTTVVRPRVNSYAVSDERAAVVGGDLPGRV